MIKRKLFNHYFKPQNKPPCELKNSILGESKFDLTFYIFF